jgi:hypothetical protein
LLRDAGKRKNGLGLLPRPRIPILRVGPYA